MASVSRTAIFAKIQKVLKKYYKPAAPPAERTVLEHLLFACVLEDARFEPAEEAFAALKHTFYDWNEMRVTSISELSEVMAVLPDPRAAANRIKRVLHAIFEELYCFDLEDKRKKNLGPTVKWLEKMDGTSKFVVAYVVQAALGGHSIPVDAGTLAAFHVLDLVSDKDVAAGEVPGLERAVGKSKGVEFGSLVHQLGADYLANPFSAQVRDILLAIDPEASKRFPQRRQPKPEPPPAEEVAPAVAAPPTATATPRKKKSEAALPAKAEGKTPEPKQVEPKPAEGKAASKATEAKPAEGKATESKAAEGKAEHKAAEPRPAESKKAAAGKKAAPAVNSEPPAAEKKAAESGTGKKAAAASEELPPAAKHPEKQHDRPHKVERLEKPQKPEKHAKAEKPDKTEKHEKQSAEASKPSAAAEGLGKRKPR
jgi:endonuclease III